MKRKLSVIFSFLLILLPIAVGFLLWDRLPSEGKIFPIVGVPLILAVTQGIFLLLTWKTMQEQNRKIFSLVLWIMPLICLLTQGIVFTAALGIEVPVGILINLPIGLMFILIGNYMPKSKQNRYFGIRIKWTLASESNWNATHRFAGKLWVIGGLLFLPCALLPLKALPFLMIALITAMVLPPVIYSYCFSKKHPGEETALRPLSKAAKIAVSCVVSLILVLTSVLLFTGNIRVHYDSDKFHITATYWADSYLYYGDVSKLTLAEQCEPGVRTYGFYSPKLSLGQFRNDDLGDYRRYTYNSCDTCIILETYGYGTYVFNAEDPQSTRALYEALSARLP